MTQSGMISSGMSPQNDRTSGLVAGDKSHYVLMCSCGVRIASCDCPSRLAKRPVYVKDGCDYCAKQAALRRAIDALGDNPALRALLR